MTPAVYWHTNYEGGGNSFGYSIHNANARQALAATGVRLDESAPVAVHVCPPQRFFPIEDKRNVAYVAWESTTMPDLFRERLMFADVICVTASFLKPLVESILPHHRVEVVPLGINFERFRYVDRMAADRRPIRQPKRRGGRPFRFLWIGAPNPRKGYKHCMKAWDAFKTAGRLGLDEHCELYMKTSLGAGAGMKEGITRVGNVIFDNRRVPGDELAEIYASAHCFLFPSVGEGFGLTFAEALATGLPSIYTPATAMLDVAPPELGIGYPVGATLVADRWHWPDADGYQTPMTVDVTIASANVTDLAVKMLRVMDNYDEAYERGRRAAEFVRRFSWEACGKRLHDVVRSVTPAKGV